jgi:hypothetical protein
MKNIFGFVTYPSTAGIIGLIWISSAIFVLFDRELSILRMVVVNMIASFFIASLGFRVEKK